MIVPFNIKTDASLLNSLIKVDDLVNIAKEYNYKALTITDNKMYNVMSFYHKCIASQIKPIIGVEINIDNNSFLLYAKNIDGYYNLVKLTSLEKITINDLKENGLILILPYKSFKLKENLETIFKDIYYGYETELEYEQIKETKCIYVNEIKALTLEDTKYLGYLNSIRTGEKLESKFSSNYLKNKEELLSLEKNVKYHEEIYNKCNLEIKYRSDLLPIYKCPNGEDSFNYLKRLCLEGIQKKLGSTVSKIYQKRLKEELNVINEMGFCNYFLIVQDYVKYAKENNILVGPGRGSAAGSLVSYVLDITDIDPIAYNLLFERFLNKMRITMPDIDVDFEFLRREEVIQYCIKKYGEKKVAGIITFGTLGAKQAVRDVAKVLNIDTNKVDSFSQKIDSKLTLKENLNNVKNLLKDPELLKMYKVATKLEGLKRHTSIHAAGIIISNINLDQVVPIEKKDDMYVVDYSMEYLEELGLLKMDFLALKNLTIIQNVLDSINKDKKILDLKDIPLNDQKTFEIFKNGNTLGIFQFEKPGMIEFLKKLKPANFEDIFAAIALYRPGPMENIDSFIKRKEGKEKIDYIDESIRDIIKPTYGIIVYQEQIMQIACVLAGYTLGEADILRRAISKKKSDILIKEQQKFVSRAVNLGHGEDVAKKIFDYILKFASYGFNRSHSVAYSFISYKMAYLKAHYYDHFMKCLLSSSIGSKIDTDIYLEECKSQNIQILNPNINKSTKNYIVTQKGILYPLSNIKNIGSSVADYIINTRKDDPFIDIYDFIRRTDRKIVTKKVIESLILSGTFDAFKINRKTLINSLDIIINYGEVIKINEDYNLKPIIEEEKDYTNKEKMEFELELFGHYLSFHPIVELRKKYPSTIPLKNIEQYFDKVIDTLVIVNSYREITNKNNQKMAFLVGNDEIKKMDYVIFSNIYDKLQVINKGDILLIRGKVEKRFDKYQIIVSLLKKIDN